MALPGGFGQRIAVEGVERAGMGAAGLRLTLQGQVQLFAKLAHPADLFCRHADHQSVGGHVFVDNGTGPHKSVFANGGAANDGAVGPQSGTFFDEGVAVFAFTLDKRAGVIHVGKHHAGAAENALFQCDVVVNTDVVLHFAVVTNHDLVTNKHVLTQRNAFSYAGATTYVHKMPHTGAFANLRAFVHDGAGVDGAGHHYLPSLAT